MRTLFTCLALLSLLSTAAVASDDQAIKGRLDEFQSAWNKDDPKAMAALWTADGSLINPFGVTAHNRADIEKIFIEEHAHGFKNTKYETLAVAIQSLTPDVALVDVSAKISGIRAPDGTPAPDFVHHVVWLFVKKDGRWMAAAARPYQFSVTPGASETKPVETK